VRGGRKEEEEGKREIGKEESSPVDHLRG